MTPRTPSKHIEYSYYFPCMPVKIDLSKLTVIIWSECTGDYFFSSKEANGVFASLSDDTRDYRLYAAITELVSTWERVDLPEISAVEYKRPTP